MIFKLGLTGSIGMGKSTTANLFAEEGCKIWDADEAVHRLYASHAAHQIENAFPGTTINEQVDRKKLRKKVTSNPDAMKKLERIIHPLIAQDRMDFIEQHSKGILVFDIPLLFETGSDKMMDATVCVTVDPATQRQRVLDRGTMSEKEFEAILSKQMPDAEKRTRATYVIETTSLDHARSQVKSILSEVGSHA